MRMAAECTLSLPNQSSNVWACNAALQDVIITDRHAQEAPAAELQTITQQGPEALQPLMYWGTRLLTIISLMMYMCRLGLFAPGAPGASG
jgi:hypothetical protein